MASQNTSLLLSNNPLFTTDDPLGLSEAEESPVPVYGILKSHILDIFKRKSQNVSPEAAVGAFITAISDISYTFHSIPDPNLNILRECLLSTSNPSASISYIVRAASGLPTYFSSGSLRPLAPSESRMYSSDHLLALLSHQLLLTLPCPSWNDWGGVNLTPWFSDANGILEPKRTYTKIALDYFINSSLPSLDISDSPHPSPQPPKTADNSYQTVTASAPHGFIPTAVFTGHGRTARLDRNYNREEYEKDNDDDKRLRVNTFLFLNAVELDAMDVPQPLNLPDFLPGMLEKDLLKAYTGFQGVLDSQRGKGKKHRIVATPWGCGAFGGDIRVKLLLLWIAASFASANVDDGGATEVVFLVKDMVMDMKEMWWKETIQRIKDAGVGADDVWRALANAREKNSTAILASVMDNLGLPRSRLM
ncbi:hypothetical protein ABW20_dc0104730 [Dactylellina cionopaga]|nr:hypothetical protein ABW20_dc0104730 [Dactylellina cionopaga]